MLLTGLARVSTLKPVQTTDPTDKIPKTYVVVVSVAPIELPYPSVGKGSFLVLHGHALYIADGDLEIGVGSTTMVLRRGRLLAGSHR